MSDPTPVAIGLDVGTGSVKATGITADGRVVRAASQPYQVQVPHGGWAEQDPEVWWRAVGQALDLLVPQLPEGRPEATVIGLTGQMHTTVLLDDQGRVVRPAVLWSDQRATAEASELAQVPGIGEITGNVPIPAFTAAHLAWLSSNEPSAMAGAAMLLNPKDFVRFRLGAGWASEPSDASATGLFDTRSAAWSLPVLQRAGIRADLLPPVVGSGAVTGCVETLPPGVADTVVRRLRGCRVVGGAGDQMAQAVALEVVRPGQLGISLGTSGAVLAALNEPGLGVFRHAVPGTWLALDSTHAAGLVLTWLAGIAGLPVGELISMASGPGNAPVFLPYLQGHRGGRGAPGALVGLDHSQGVAELAYAAMEGVAFELARLAHGLVGRVREKPLPEVIRLGGGGGRSTLWRLILACATERPVLFTDRDSAFGAAVVAARADGWYERFTAADSEPATRTDPDPDWLPRLRDRQSRFEELLAAVLGDSDG